ncbi:MAG: glycosyltransferase [Cyclobacteriaceae bacterium]|nr:glycosyltransferase [Cyclobacteriaceae bacterium]
MSLQRDYDIIMMALPRWDGAYASTAYSTAKELSLFVRVYYVDNPFTFKDIIAGIFSNQVKKRLKALLFGKNLYSNPEPSFPNLTIVTPRAIFPINWLPAGSLYQFFLTLNDLIVKRSIDRTIKQFGIKKFVYINSFNPFYGFKSALPFCPSLFIYQSVDDISRSEYIAKHGTALEVQMMKQADITLVTSSELYRIKSPIAKRIFLIPNAADTAHFNKALNEVFDKPMELLKVPENRKIICYIGNICHRIDYTILKEVAAVHHDKLLLLIGPITGNQLGASGLVDFPNVMLTGPKSVQELPAYLQYCHCCIIPFLKNELTRSIYPLKVNEYLAAGKPVVSTNFSEDIDSFSDVIRICDHPIDFAKLIDEAINTDSDENVQLRVLRSSKNNWKSRVGEILQRIQSEMS